VIEIKAKNIFAAFLELFDVNVICLDWSGPASALYPISVSYVPEMGRHAGSFIDWLIGHGSRVEDFHIIGHSLGGQLVGFIGRSIASGKVPYITCIYHDLLYEIDV
jgi:hypothetical protein